MRLTGYEIKKLMTQIPLWIAFIGLFVGNLFLLFMIQKKRERPMSMYISKKINILRFCEGNEQADELGFYEAGSGGTETVSWTLIGNLFHRCRTGQRPWKM